MSFKTLRDVDLSGKTVLLRADLNVPAKDGVVTDTTRIDRLKPTIDWLVKNGAKTLVLSHFGRPDGQRNDKYSLKFILPALKKSWGVDVAFATDCIGEPAKTLSDTLKSGQVGLLENLRFHAGEEANDAAFVRELAKLGTIYVNDAFSAAHRAHASTEGLAHILPAYAGFLMEAELNALTSALESPKKPVMALVGGSKISTKLSVLNNLVGKVDYLVLGGGMANTFLYAKNINVGNSLCEKNMADEARAIMATAAKSGCQIILPVDHIVVKDLKEGAEFISVAAGQIPADMGTVDIGAESIKAVQEILKKCHTVLWNGPVGVFEIKPFDKGTNELAHTVAHLTQNGTIVSVAGGGDTVSALENAGVADKLTYVSTAGGAFLEWLEGKTLPGVAALTTCQKAA